MYILFTIKYYDYDIILINYPNIVLIFYRELIVNKKIFILYTIVLTIYILDDTNRY